MQSIRLVLTHVPYARMDRAAPGQRGFTLQYVADFINWLNFDEVVLRDPHSDVSAALIRKSTEVSCMDGLLAQVWQYLDPEKTVLVFPDAGAQKKYERLITPKTAYLVGHKHRDFATHRIVGLELSNPSTAKNWGRASVRSSLTISAPTAAPLSAQRRSWLNGPSPTSTSPSRIARKRCGRGIWRSTLGRFGLPIRWLLPTWGRAGWSGTPKRNC